MPQDHPLVSHTLAKAMDVQAQAVADWLSGREDIPRKVAAWLEALAFVHEAADETRPATDGEGFDTAQAGAREIEVGADFCAEGEWGGVGGWLEYFGCVLRRLHASANLTPAARS